MNPAPFLHLDLDGAWLHDDVSLIIPEAAYLDCRKWGPQLRFCAPPDLMESFHQETHLRLAPFLLYGSGDFHHLSALWLRKIDRPFMLVSFDNHPDWDIRPPRWCCGSWISRALELPNLQQATVWGLGNFELEWPNRVVANWDGIRAGRLDARPWAERLKPKSAKHWNSITRENWREHFASFAEGLAGTEVYVTVDIDCLDPRNAATNWENGLFTAQEIAWALDQLSASAEIVGGDLCGAYSPQHYARFTQRFAARMDHPKLPPVDPSVARERNLRTLGTIWPALTAQAQGVIAR